MALEPDRLGISAQQLSKFFTNFCGDKIEGDDDVPTPVFLPTTLSQECTGRNRDTGWRSEHEPNVYAVNEFFVKPRTEVGRPDTNGSTVSYAELLNPEGLDIEFYVVHHWGQDFAEFTRSIAWHALMAPRLWDSTYWVSLFALDQHQPLLGPTMAESAFHRAMASDKNKGVVISVNPTATCLFRAWCAYEILLAHTNGKPVTVSTPSGVPDEKDQRSPEKDQSITHMHQMLKFIDINTGEATLKSDVQRIEEAVRDYVGDGVALGHFGAAALNRVVQAKLADQAIFTLIRQGNAEGVRQALSLRASADNPTPRGIRPLTVAKGCRHRDAPHRRDSTSAIVKMLLEHRADPMAGDDAATAIEVWDTDNRVRATALRKLRELQARKPEISRFHQRSYELALQTHKEKCGELHRKSQHYSGKGLNLCYAPTRLHVRQAKDIIDNLRHSPNDEQEILKEMLRKEGARNIDPVNTSDPKTLLMCISDFEPDDIMAIAQVWHLHRDEHPGAPLVCMAADLERDHPPIYEMKALIAVTMLGLTKWNVCLAQTDANEIRQPQTPNPNLESMIRRHHAGVENICQTLANFKGESIKLFLMAPCRGNLNAVVKRLKEMGSWPLSAKWCVRLYSGSYNIKGMTPGDITALHEVMAESTEPLVDMAKFVCFGGAMSHSCTSNFTTFVLPSLASALNINAPLLAAALKLFSDRFNSKLIQPKPGLFGCERCLEEKLTAEEIERFESIRKMHNMDHMEATENYATQLVDDAALFEKVANFKKSTLFAIANKKDDSPLCDQLLFLFEWHQMKKQNFFKTEVGEWVYNSKSGFTMVDDKEESGRFRATQPVMEDPFDEDTLDLMRKTLQDYLLNHLSQVYASDPTAT